MAEIIRTNGKKETVEVPKEGRLKFLQNIVGGLIQIVYLGCKHIMLVNEEGLILKLPPNEEATKIAGHLIVGDAILVEERVEFS